MAYHHNKELNAGYHDVHSLMKLKGFSDIDKFNTHYLIEWNQEAGEQKIWNAYPRDKILQEREESRELKENHAALLKSLELALYWLDKGTYDTIQFHHSKGEFRTLSEKSIEQAKAIIG